jgi:glycosyltransferase involved in cell wall biosynthesis
MDVRISVIVTAYNRKRYLLGAVKSALNQTLPRDHYEVIVIKNFRDDLIDSKLNEWGVTNLYSESVGYGAKIYEALQAAKGEVISFLDDDDEFLPGKLQAVYEAFKRGVVYYHNSQQFINESGRVLGARKGNSYIIESRDKPRYLPFFVHYEADFNSSSTAVARELLKEYASYLKDLETAPDTFCFVVSLVSDGSLVLDGRPLTRFRQSSSQSTVDLTSIAALARKRISALERIVKAYQQMLRIVDGTPYQEFLRCRTAVMRSVEARSDLSGGLIKWLTFGDLLFLFRGKWVADLRDAAFLLYAYLVQFAPRRLRRMTLSIEYAIKLKRALGV